MPDGKTHFEYYTRGWVAILPTSIILSVGINPILGVSTMLGYALGRWIDPDLDQVSITSAEGRILNDFRILGYIMVGYSTIYGAVFRKHHRSFITHFPFVSTAIRLLYFFWWVYFLRNTWHPWYWMVILGVWIGLSVADTVHYLLDNLYKDE